MWLRIPAQPWQPMRASGALSAAHPAALPAQRVDRARWSRRAQGVCCALQSPPALCRGQGRCCCPWAVEQPREAPAWWVPGVWHVFPLPQSSPWHPRCWTSRESTEGCVVGGADVQPGLLVLARCGEGRQLPRCSPLTIVPRCRSCPGALHAGASERRADRAELGAGLARGSGTGGAMASLRPRRRAWAAAPAAGQGARVPRTALPLELSFAQNRDQTCA